jgi:hypothetical protein
LRRAPDERRARAAARRRHTPSRRRRRDPSRNSRTNSGCWTGGARLLVSWSQAFFDGDGELGQTCLYLCGVVSSGRRIQTLGARCAITAGSVGCSRGELGLTESDCLARTMLAQSGLWSSLGRSVLRWLPDSLSRRTTTTEHL